MTLEADELPEWARELAVFDTETTGLVIDTTRIVSAHVSVLTSTGESTQARNWLINPGVEIPEQASNVHGITTEFVQLNGLNPEEAIFDIVSTLEALFDSGIPVVAYNASYDFSILNREAIRYGVDPIVDPRPVIDPMIIDRQLDKYRKGKRTLDAATTHYEVDLTNAHDAEADAIAAGRVAQAIAKKFSRELSVSALTLHDSQVVWAAEQAASFAEYMRRQGRQTYRDDGKWPVR